MPVAERPARVPGQLARLLKLFQPKAARRSAPKQVGETRYTAEPNLAAEEAIEKSFDGFMKDRQVNLWDLVRRVGISALRRQAAVNPN